jgi:membrane associated rhomboid family serine protease
MIPAAVGFQCPDDVRAGNRTVRAPRTTFGSRVATGDPAIVTKILLGLNLLVFVAVQADATLVGRLYLTSGVVFAGGGVATGEWYRLLTSAFLHQNLVHLGLNMYALWLFGPPLEAAFGRARFTATYLLSALTGAAASYAFGSLAGASLGASGAIFGLFAAHLVVNRRLGRENGGLWALLAINAVFGFVVAGIDWRAHVGGFVGGALAAAAIAYAPSARRTLVQVAGLVVVLALAVGLVTWRTVDAVSRVGVATTASAVLECEVQHPSGGATFTGCLTD